MRAGATKGFKAAGTFIAYGLKSIAQSVLTILAGALLLTACLVSTLPGLAFVGLGGALMAPASGAAGVAGFFIGIILAAFALIGAGWCAHEVYKNNIEHVTNLSTAAIDSFQSAVFQEPTKQFVRMVPAPTIESDVSESAPNPGLEKSDSATPVAATGLAPKNPTEPTEGTTTEEADGGARQNDDPGASGNVPRA